MKTLAIFGDSWAADATDGSASYKFKHLAWPNLIDPTQWTVNNHAQAGTSFYWTYRLFLEQHSQYDHIVCIVTNPGRITLRDEPYLLGRPFGSGGYDHCEWLLQQTNQPLDHRQRRIMEAIRDYMVYAMDYEYETTAAEQLLEHLRRVRPDAIFIPMSSALTNLCPPEYTSMFDFTAVMMRSLKPTELDQLFPLHQGWLPGLGKSEEKELIQCHMTPEVNQLMARAVEQALITGKWDPQLPSRVEHAHTFDHYYSQVK
jgi:hypothetical protein